MQTSPIEIHMPDRYVAAHRARARVIVADDDDDIVNLVSTALRGFGFEIVRATTGGELLAKAGCAPRASDRTTRTPDIVITDIWMPGPNGLDVLEAIRQKDDHTIVVLMTAYPDQATRARAIELGADAFFAKPFDIQELVTTVLNLAPVPPGDRD
jgi:DNA-binding response OmpR family regulator